MAKLTPTLYSNEDRNGCALTLAQIVSSALLDRSLAIDARWALYYEVDLAMDAACKQLEDDQKAAEQLEIEETQAHERAHNDFSRNQ